MKILNTYLDNMFANLPKTKEILKMKDDLLVNMEEKYWELKNEGKTENEAIGIVISEFGNIDELAKELGIIMYDFEAQEETITKDEAEEYLASSKKNGKLIALGVFFLITSPILLLLLIRNNIDLSQTAALIFGILGILFFIAIAVGLFIYAGFNLNKFEYLKGNVIIPQNIKENIKIKENKFNKNFIASLILSLTLFIISPATVIIFAVLNYNSGYEKFNINLGLSILLFIIAFGVFLVTKVGIVKNSFNVLLQTGEYRTQKTRAENLVGIIGSIYWPLITIIYILWSFLGEAWQISWLLWVVAGIAFGIISATLNAVVKEKNDKKRTTI